MRKARAEAGRRIVRQNGDDGGVRPGGGFGNLESGALLVACHAVVELFGFGAFDGGGGAEGETVSAWRRAGP